MPKTDVNDNRIMHNLQGIDLRKNAESNSAEDMVNLWVNSENYLTNRPMPSLYTAGSITYNGNYKFACECKNLSSDEVEIDISSAESIPVVLSVVNDNASGEIWITGANLETVRTILWVATNSGCLVSGVDFSFYYDRGRNRIAVVMKEEVSYDDYEYFVLISPYGQVTTPSPGSVPDYYFGPYNEYRLRTYSFSGIPQLAIEAKQSNGSYAQIQVFGDSSVTGVQDKIKHYKVILGTNDLTFCFSPQSPTNMARFVAEGYANSVELVLVSYDLSYCQRWSGAKSSGEMATGATMVSMPDPLYLGIDNRFKFEGGHYVVTLSELVGDTYNPIAEFSEE